MKRTFIIIIAMVACIVANAQWRFGVHADMLATTATVGPLKDYDIKAKYKVGPMVGAMASYSVNNWFDLQLELNYALRGYADEVIMGIDGVFTPNIERLSMRASYLEVPVMAKFFPVPAIGLNVQIGPQVGILLGHKLSTKSEEIKELSVGDGNKADLGLNFGLGYEARHWALTFRYSLGLMKAPSMYTDSHNRGFSMGVGYFF